MSNSNNIEKINVVRKPEVFEDISKHDLIQFQRADSSEWTTLTGEDFRLLVETFQGKRGFMITHTPELEYNVSEVVISWQRDRANGEAHSTTPIYDDFKKEWFGDE